MTGRGQILAALGVAVVVAGGWYATRDRAEAPPTDQSASLQVPPLDGPAAEGAALFVSKCAACHGESAAGTNEGPPLVHKIYEPNHHADIAFLMAAMNGARAHHWPFGDMPPVDGVTEADVAKIVAYVRALQRANGIY